MCIFCPPVLIVPGEKMLVTFLLSPVCAASHPATRLSSAVSLPVVTRFTQGRKIMCDSLGGLYRRWLFSLLFPTYNQSVTNSSLCIFFSGSRLLTWTKTCVQSLQLPSSCLAVCDLAINYRSSSRPIQPHGYSQDVHLQENETGMLFWLRTFWAWLLVHVRPCAW